MKMNQTINNWTDITLSSLNDITSKIAQILPNILGALLILVFGWLLTKLMLFLIKRFLKVIDLEGKFRKLKQKTFLNGIPSEINMTRAILSLIKYTFYIVILSVVFNVLGWDSISVEVTKLLAYLPKLFSGIAIFIAGLYIAGFVKQGMLSLSGTVNLAGGRFISQVSYFIILIIISVTALNQAGVDTTVITNNITIILGACLLIVTLALGLGSKNIVGQLLQTFYTKKYFKVGQYVTLENGVEGEIVAMDNIYVSIDIKNEILVIPINKFSQESNKIKKG
ncbi:mechanosensitive ion channel family protein [Sinomicrobium sp. M5D2P17]